MGSLPAGGKMLAIGASVEQVQKWVQGREADVSIATVNGPRSVVISGKAEAVMAVDELAQAAGRQTKELEVSHAFHSPLMDPILAELTEVATSMRIHPARIPIASNTTGEFYSDSVPVDYWSTHVRQAVLFHRGMQNIIDAGCTMIVEVGPHPALTPAVVTAFDAPYLHTIPTLKKDKNDVNNILGSLASLHVNGSSLKLNAIFGSAIYQRIRLPLYPFRREKYWLTSNGFLDVAPGAYPLAAQNTGAEQLPELPALHPLLGKALTHTSKKAVFETSMKTSIPWTDHRVLDSTIFPGTGYLEMAARGFAAASGTTWRPVELKDVSFERPLVLSYKEEKKVTLTLEFGSNRRDVANFTITCAGTTHCRGRIVVLNNTRDKADLAQELAGKTAEMKIGPFYGDLRVSGLDFGARFANVRELWMGKPGSGEAFSRVTQGSGVSDDDPYKNVVLLDSCQHAIGASINTLGENSHAGPFVPASIQSITMRAQLPAQIWSHIHISSSGDGRAANANIRVLGDDGEVLVEIENLELRRMTSLTPGKGSVSSSGPNGSHSENQIFKTRAELVGLLQPLAQKERVLLVSKWLSSEIKETMGHAAEGLSLDRLPPSTVFLEIGLDSLLVTELQRRIQEKLMFRFKPMQGLDYQSIESLAEYILNDVLIADLQTEIAPAD
jgi:acyl transferase domain-containing protein